MIKYETDIEQSWVDIREVTKIFGMTLASMHNAIQRGTFPVLTYKLGKRRVIDKSVLAAYFEQRKTEGMAHLKKKG